MPAPSVESDTPLLKVNNTPPPSHEKMLTSDAQRQNGWWQRRQSMPKQHLNLWQVASGATAQQAGSTSDLESSLLKQYGSSRTVDPLQMPKDERVRVGSANTTVAILQGPHNHAIWKARLLCALNAEDERIYGAATGTLRFSKEDDQQTGDKLCGEAAEEEQDKKRFHARAIAMITSTLPDETFALVVGQNVDAFKLMEALDARFRPYPRYPGI